MPEPRRSRTLLERAGILPAELATALRALAGCRDVAVRDDRRLELGVVASIAVRHLDDLLAFTRLASRLRGGG